MFSARIVRTGDIMFIQILNIAEMGISSFPVREAGLHFFFLLLSFRYPHPSGGALWAVTPF